MDGHDVEKTYFSDPGGDGLSALHFKPWGLAYAPKNVQYEDTYSPKPSLCKKDRKTSFFSIMTLLVALPGKNRQVLQRIDKKVQIVKLPRTEPNDAEDAPSYTNNKLPMTKWDLVSAYHHKADP